MSDEFPEQISENRGKTQILVNSANIIDQADQQMLPAVYTSLENQLGFTPTENGFITTARAFLQAISTPFWGFLGDKYSRNKILAFGCFIWGFFTILVASSRTFETMLLSRALTGIGLAVILPTANSLLADYFPESTRGRAFGLIGLTGVLGAVIGTLYSTTIKDEYIGGIPGWSFAFYTIALVSIILGVVILFYGKDPIRGASEKQLAGLVSKETEERYQIKRSDYKKILTNKTYVLILAQGVAGTIPWAAIAFIIAWFEYVGFPAFTAAIAFAIIAMGAALGNLFGGILGDKAAQWNPDRGRIIIAQISVFSGIPLIITTFWLIPRDTSLFLLFVFIGFVTGFMIIWTAPGANYPIFAEIFEPEIRSSAYGIDRLFEGSIAAAGTLFVGILAENFFGYIDPQGVPIADLSTTIRNANVNALADGMVVTMVLPWIFCFLLYFSVYKTYPQDRDRMNAILDARKSELIKNV